MSRARELARLGNANIISADSSFNVGLGTTTSIQYKLDVVGDANFSGVVTATSFSGDGSSLTGVAATDYIVSNSLKVLGISTFSGEVTAAGGVDVTGGVKSAGIVTFTNTTASTSSATGALVVSGGVGIAGSLHVGENVSVGGTLTYEDVTNIDSVGIVTAQTGVRVTAGGLVVTAGVSTLAADLSIADTIVHTGDTNTKIRFPAADTISAETGGTERLRIDSSGNSNFGAEKAVAFPSGTGIQVYHSTNPRIKLTNDTTGNSGTDGTQFYLSSDGETILDNKDSKNIRIDVGGSQRVGITSNGDIGVGAATPTTLTNSVGITLKGKSSTPAGFINFLDSADNSDARIVADNGSLQLQADASDNTASSEIQFYIDQAEKAKITSTGGWSLNNGELIERCYINSTAWSTNGDINLDNGMVQYNSANLAGTNNTLNITSSVGINTQLATGDMISVTCITAVNATTAYVNHITIDHIAVTENWVGGSAPTDGGGSGLDTYAFNIIKTGSAAWKVIANQVKTS